MSMWSTDIMHTMQDPIASVHTCGGKIKPSQGVCVCAFRVLQQNSEYIPNVLAVFLGDAGIGHPDEVSQCDAWHIHTSIWYWQMSCHSIDTACCLLLNAEAYP